MTNLLPFELLNSELGVGSPLPGAWRPLADHALVILVGVTGVGKSTVLAHLGEIGLDYTLLPDRRVLTDRLIISTIQARDGQPVRPVVDRGVRFGYTRRYRDLYPGGMAHALSQVSASPALSGRLLLFDGLRGANEVQHAAQLMPHAHFAMLDAPDAVRVQRLLGRSDTFDTIRVMPVTGQEAAGPETLADLGLPEAAGLLSDEEASELLAWVRAGLVSADDLRAKLGIVLEERRSYNPAATRSALEAAAPRRTLVLDTVALSASEAAHAIAGWLQG